MAKALYDSVKDQISDVHLDGEPVPQNANQSVIDFPDDRMGSDVSLLTYNGSAVVDRPAADISKIQAIRDFDPDKMGLDLRTVLPNLSSFNLRFEFAALDAYARAKNFTDMKSYLQLLITNNVMTQADYDLVNGVMKNQNVDLDTF